ncbi:MAG: hypothetical protein ACRBCK_10095 [Alphaproteobacteria bacterium]
MSFYNRLAATALKQIEKRGRTITIKRAGGTYSPVNGLISSDTVKSPKALFRDYKIHEVDGSKIILGDKQMLVAGNVDISVDDVITDGLEYKVLHIIEVKPGDLCILKKVQVRR